MCGKRKDKLLRSCFVGLQDLEAKVRGKYLSEFRLGTEEMSYGCWTKSCMTLDSLQAWFMASAVKGLEFKLRSVSSDGSVSTGNA